MTKITLDELVADPRGVINSVLAGETFSLCVDGRTVAELTPCDEGIGANRPRKRLRDIQFEPLVLNKRVDAVQLVRDEREDHVPLP